MNRSSASVDDYIARAPEFAQPILVKLRKAFHKACPEIEETIKWGQPHFEHRGVVANMGAYKRYVRWRFWKNKLLRQHEPFKELPKTLFERSPITDVSGLPAEKLLLALIRHAVALNAQGVKLPPRKKKVHGELQVPSDLLAALKKNRKAQAAFAAFSPTHQREYVYWITQAKQDATRQKRVATATEWIAEGKSRNWKYRQK